MEEVASKRFETGTFCLLRYVSHGTHGRHVQDQDGGGKDRGRLPAEAHSAAVPVHLYFQVVREGSIDTQHGRCSVKVRLLQIQGRAPRLLAPLSCCITEPEGLSQEPTNSPPL